MSSFFIPIPVSVTRISNLFSPETLAETVTLPRSVNLTALLRKFINICLTRLLSLKRLIDSGIFVVSASSFPFKTGTKGSITSFTILLSLNSSGESSTLPASILEISRMSLIRLKRYSELFFTMVSCFFCSSFKSPVIPISHTHQ